MECDGTTSLWLGMKRAPPFDRGSAAEAIRGQQTKDPAPEVKAASCRSTP